MNTQATETQGGEPLSPVAHSITGFFVDFLGGTPVAYEDRPEPGSVHVHFENCLLDESLSFSFPDTELTKILTAHQTLVMSEPVAPSLTLEWPQPEELTHSVHLGFLDPEQNPLATATLGDGSERIAQIAPDRPLDQLKALLEELNLAFEKGVPVGTGITQQVKEKLEEAISLVVQRYYPVVDRGSPEDLAEIVEMFAEEGVYDRAGLVLRGQEEIARFYGEERTLSGQHTVHTFSVDRLTAHVTGVFEGVSLRDGTPRRIEFADRWKFDLSGEVVFRHTYLSEGHESTT